MATPKSDSGGTAGTQPVFPSDPGNINAPVSPATPPKYGVINTDDSSGVQYITVLVNGKPINIPLNTQVLGDTPTGGSGDPLRDILTGPTHAGPPLVDKTPANEPLKGVLPGGTNKTSGVPFVAAPDTVLSKLNSIQDWYKDAGTRKQIIDEMYAAGLITSKKSPSIEEVALAWGLVVQESALQSRGTGSLGSITPEQLLSQAAQKGWNNIQPNLTPADVGAHGTGNANNSTETSSQSETIYKSYVDPATAMGALADAWYRLVGRNPTSEEYQAFLNGVIKPYQDQENTGKFETKETGPNMGNIDPTTGQPVDSTGNIGGTSTQTNVVSQRGIGTRGLQFLAGQQALASPDSANYQAATTVFGAILKALGSPGSGITDSGPTNAIP
ncbi:MAG TPA: hypothetical protein VFK47_00835 [Ktedonobacteraceae bacterium]|nr:hypothetical protein [Ktedonobacteraceae bacterium]